MNRLKVCRPQLMILWLFLGIGLLQAQYVRREDFATERQRRLRYQLDDWVSYTTSRQFSSMAVGTNYLYIATLDGGILRYHLYENEWDYPFTTSSGLPSNTVLQVAYDPETSFLWAITPNDTAIFLPADQLWIHRSQEGRWNFRFPYSRPVPSEGPSTIQRNRFYPRQFLDRLPMLFGNHGYTITGDWEVIDPFLRSFPIQGFLKDRWDRVWLAVNGLGVGIGDLFSQRVNFWPMGLSDIYPQALAYDGDDLWIGGIPRGTGRSGIVHWRNSDGGWEYYEARYVPNLRSDYVTSLLVEGKRIWFATNLGVAMYDKQKGRWRQFTMGSGLISDTVLDLALFDGYLYVATDQGISRIRLDSLKVQRVKDQRFTLLAFRRLATSESELWAATDRGIFVLPRHSQGWLFLPSMSPVSDFRATAVTTFRQEVWFAAQDGILMLNRATGQWETYPQVALEVPGPYTDIQANASTVWVATPVGLLKFDRQRRFWRLFTREDGLLDNHCNRLLLDGDYLWIATDTGLTQFYWNSPNRID